MVHHSKLRSDDGLIVGASQNNSARVPFPKSAKTRRARQTRRARSTTAHLEDNLAAIAEGPLDDAVVQAFDAGWKLVQQAGICPSYARGTSKYD